VPGDGDRVNVQRSSVTEWRETFEADERATFFHGPTWAEIWEEQTGGAVSPRPVRVDFGAGRKAILGVTRVPTRLPRIKRDELSPEGNCGGWVTTEALGERDMRTLAGIILSSPACVWRLGPADPEAQRLALPGGRAEVTHVIDLRDGAAGARAAWQAEARRTAARARRRGARLVEGTTNREWDAYARLYDASLKRWDTPLFAYDRSLFSQLARHADEGVHLWLVDIDGSWCAGAVVLVHRGYATYWHGASIPELCPGAANLLQWDLLAELEQQGIHTYDLNGSGPLPGVVRFKESLGAERRPVVVYERKHPLERAASRLKHPLKGRR
jgi:hypothetical protein